MELTTRQILNNLLAGKTVKLLMPSTEEATRLHNTLAVLKSRDKKLTADIGLIASDEILSKTLEERENGTLLTMRLVKKKPRPTFAVLSIEDEEQG